MKSRYLWRCIISVSALVLLMVKIDFSLAEEKPKLDQTRSNIVIDGFMSKPAQDDKGESGIGRPGYRLSLMSVEAKSFHDSIQRKIANGEPLSWADRQVIRELQVLRQWPVPPQLADEQKRFVEYINGLDRPLNFSERILVKHLVGQGLWPDGKDLLPSGTDRSFIDYYNSLTPERLGGMAELMKSWRTAKGVTMDIQQNKNIVKDELPPDKIPDRGLPLLDVRKTEEGQGPREADKKWDKETASTPTNQGMKQGIEEGRLLKPVIDAGAGMSSVKSREQGSPEGRQVISVKNRSTTELKEIQLVTVDVHHVWQVSALKELLRQIKGIKEVIQRSFVSGVAIFDVHFSGDSQALAEELTLANSGYFRLKVLGVMPNKLDMKLVESGS